MLNLFKTALPLLGSALFSQKGKLSSEKALQAEQERYRRDLSKLNNLFDRDFYGNMLDRSDVRGLLGNLREQMTETTRTLKNRAAITGATPESIVATQKAQNQAYGNAVSQIAQQSTAWKEAATHNYLSARSALENSYRPTLSAYRNNMDNYSLAPYQSLQGLLSSTFK